jgi:hypothetical protein
VSRALDPLGLEHGREERVVAPVDQDDECVGVGVRHEAVVDVVVGLVGVEQPQISDTAPACAGRIVGMSISRSAPTESASSTQAMCTFPDS